MPSVSVYEREHKQPKLTGSPFRVPGLHRNVLQSLSEVPWQDAESIAARHEISEAFAASILRRATDAGFVREANRLYRLKRKGYDLLAEAENSLPT